MDLVTYANLVQRSIWMLIRNTTGSIVKKLVKGVPKTMLAGIVRISRESLATCMLDTAIIPKFV